MMRLTNRSNGSTNAGEKQTKNQIRTGMFSGDRSPATGNRYK